jgi:hypothetical protein
MTDRFGHTAGSLQVSGCCFWMVSGLYLCRFYNSEITKESSFVVECSIVRDNIWSSDLIWQNLKIKSIKKQQQKNRKEKVRSDLVQSNEPALSPTDFLIQSFIAKVYLGRGLVWPRAGDGSEGAAAAAEGVHAASRQLPPSKLPSVQPRVLAGHHCAQRSSRL